MASLLKRVERAWRAAWMRALARLLPRTRGPVPDWSARPYRILYLRYDRIGDMILATPLIRAIATSHPTLTVDVLASPVNAPVLEGNPHVRRVHRFDARRKAGYWRALRTLRRERYDAVVDDHAAVRKASLTMIFVMLATGARHRIGVAGQENEFIYTIPVAPAPRGHQLEMAAVIARVFGVEPDLERWRPEIALTNDEKARADEAWRGVEARAAVATPRRLLVNASAAIAKRQWPRERYIAVVRDVARRHPDLAIGVIGAPREWEVVRAIAEAVGASALETPGVRDAFALVAGADAIFTPDTSITHAAVAFRVPVAVFILTSSAAYVPWRVPHRLVWVHERTFADLPAEPVIEAVDDLLRNAAPRRRR
ncbi:MAG TPA: glycosyltransferase family 9 protein [Gemmatimonadaceae bacterium]|nr:glycosyltransferase family 9 protein [Gemmatimonadaceae bacterium]